MRTPEEKEQERKRIVAEIEKLRSVKFPIDSTFSRDHPSIPYIPRKTNSDLIEALEEDLALLDSQ